MALQPLLYAVMSANKGGYEMEYQWCKKCNMYQYGTIETGGFRCGKCGNVDLLYISPLQTTDVRS